jgi:mono/diheme cytochrome c family protein
MTGRGKAKSAFERAKAMMAWRGQAALGAAILALFFASQAGAQENLDSGKTPAQLFASDCAICHKSPTGLSKAGNRLGGLRGLQGFLQEHYTASREAAAAIAAYIQATDRGPSPAEHKRTAKPKEKGQADRTPGRQAQD